MILNIRIIGQVSALLTLLTTLFILPSPLPLVATSDASAATVSAASTASASVVIASVVIASVIASSSNFGFRLPIVGLIARNSLTAHRLNML